MIGWADLNKAIINIKREHDVDNTHILKLLSRETDTIIDQMIQSGEIKKKSKSKTNNSYAM